MFEIEALHEKLEVWNRFVREYPDGGKQLRTIASQMHESNSLKVPITAVRQEVLQIAVTCGMLRVSEGGVAFAEREIFLYYLACEICETSILPVWGDLEAVANFLNEPVRRTLTDFEHIEALLVMILIVLNKVYQKNVLQKYLDVICMPDHINRLWRLQSNFNQALPYLEIHIDPLVRLIMRIQEQTNDLGAGGIYNAIGKLCFHQVDVGNQLYDILSENNYEIWSALAAALVGLSQRLGVESVYSMATRLLESSHKEVVDAGILALSLFNYEKAQPVLLNATLEAFESINIEGECEYAALLTKAYGNLLGQDQRVTVKILSLSKSNDPEVIRGIVSILFSNVKGLQKEEWFRECLLNVASTAPCEKGIADYLDMCLLYILRDDPDYVFLFLDKWIRNHTVTDKEDSSLVELFDSVIHESLNIHHSHLESWMTRWLYEEHSSFHVAVTEMVEQFAIHRVFLSLSKEILDTLTVENVKFVIRKIMGYLVNGESLCTLVFSTLQREPEDERLNQYVKDVFNDYIMYNYPGITNEFMKEKVEGGEGIGKQVAKCVMDGWAQYRSRLENLSIIKELEPPERRAHDFLNKQAKIRSREIVKSSREKSVFLNLMQHIVLKGGETSFTKTQDRYTEKSGLSEMSWEMELPRMLKLDKVGQELLRRKWRNEKREDGDHATNHS